MLSDHFWARFSNSLGTRGLRWTGRLNVPVYRLTRGRLANKVGEGPILLLTTTGRKSGRPRTAPVLYLARGDAMIVIDTNAGNDRRPAWSRNLEADPRAEVEIGRRKLKVTARIAQGDERDELWRACNDQYGGFDQYIEWLERTPSVWVLEPVGGPGVAIEDADVGTTRESAATAGDFGPADTI
jgi:deazaflavin-dependent oxidoreductase (nitroreductase family)